MGLFDRDVVAAYIVDMELHKILMGIKKTDPGRGIIIGPGGHMECSDNNDPLRAVQREVFQELGLLFEIEQIVQMGEFKLRFENKPDLTPTLHTFLIFGSTRGATETKEMIPIRCSFSNLRFLYQFMLEGEARWLEPALQKVRSKGTIIRERPLGKLISMDIAHW